MWLRGAGGALDRRAAQLARPGAALGTVRSVAVSTPIAADLPVDRRAAAPHPSANLADAEPHLHQAAQAASLLKFKLRVVRPHGNPGHSRCRTWFANLADRPGERGVFLFLPLLSVPAEGRSQTKIL
jgi:hypothetical protein